MVFLLSMLLVGCLLTFDSVDANNDPLEGIQQNLLKISNKMADIEKLFNVVLKEVKNLHDEKKAVRKEDGLSLVAYSHGELTLHSLGGGAEVKKIEALFPVDSLAYDEKEPRLYWGSDKMRAIGYFDSSFRHMKLLMKLSGFVGNIAVDSVNQLLFFFHRSNAGVWIGKVELTNKRVHKIVDPKLDVKDVMMNKIRLMVDAGSRNILTIHEDKRWETKVVRRSYTGMVIGEFIVRNRAANTLVFAQDLDQFLYCDSDYFLMKLSANGLEKWDTGLRCPYGIRTLVYFKKSMCMLNADGWYLATFDGKNGPAKKFAPLLLSAKVSSVPAAMIAM